MPVQPPSPAKRLLDTSVCPTLSRSKPGKRRLLIGRTDGGRILTLVIERTDDPTTWLIVTGWSSTDAERKIWKATEQ
jgi:hypothetical protein